MAGSAEGTVSKSILYIEDNPNDQRFVSKVLGAHGYTVIVAEDGAAGVKLAEEHKPDLILVDVQMPNLNGLETARLLRELPCCAQTVIVALTAYADQYKRPLYLEAGCTEYQQKQAGIQPLLALVKRYLE
jgi:two-component system cell cycle response regulator DivK